MPKDLKIPNIIIKSKALGSDAKVILGLLLQESAYLAPESISISSLANTAGMSEKNVSAALSQLALAKFLQLCSPGDLPEITLAEATDIACHLDIRVELRKTPLRSQGELPLDEDGDSRDDFEVVDGENYRWELTEDIEEPGKVFLNVWKVDSDGHDEQHIIQGVQFESEEDATEWWNKFKAKENATILDWLVTLAPSDSDVAGRLYVQISEDTFGEVITFLESIAPSAEAGDDQDVIDAYFDSLTQFTADAEIPLHGRIYSWDTDDPEEGYSFDSEAAESDTPAESDDVEEDDATTSDEDSQEQDEEVVVPDESDDHFRDATKMVDPETEDGEDEELMPEEEAFFQHPKAVEALKLLQGAKGLTELKLRNAFEFNADQTEELAKLMIDAGFLSGKAPRYIVEISQEDLTGWIEWVEANSDLNEEEAQKGPQEDAPDF